MGTPSQAGIARLPLETAVFGRPCGRARTHDADTSGWWFLHYRGDAEPPGYRHISTLVTFEISGKPEATGARNAVAEDIVWCRPLARCFSHDRLHADDRLPRDGAHEVKARWIENSILYRADHAWVMEGGFLTVVGGRVDLICVDPAFRGRNIGRRLLSEAFRVYSSLLVGTQASNEAAIRLYRGFDCREIGRTEDFHWLGKSDRPHQ